MREVELNKLKEIVVEPRREVVDEMPRMFEKYGRDESLLKLSVAMMEAEVDTFANVSEILEQSHELGHLCGIHKLKASCGIQAEEMRWFFSRLWSAPKVLAKVPHLKDYIATICDQSNRYLFPYGDTEIDVSYRRTRQTFSFWQKKVSALPKVRIIVPKLNEFYPYITSAPNEEIALILTVDSLVPKGIPNQARADICQDMIVAVLSGEIDIENLKDATPKYVKEFFKMFPMKYGHISLDAPIYHDDNKYSLIDKISTEEAFDYNPPTSKNYYGKALDDAKTVEDLAERLGDAWQANRLTKDKPVINPIPAKPLKKTEIHCTNSQSSYSLNAMNSQKKSTIHARNFTYAEKLKKQDRIEEAISDYKDQRLIEELEVLEVSEADKIRRLASPFI